MLGVATVATVTGCSGSGSHAAADAASSNSGRPGAKSTFVPMRWWSNSAVKVGSIIDPNHPDAAAEHLHSSQTEYCGMLKQTLSAGKSILPGVTSADPALLASTQAFVAEITAVSSGAIAIDWKTIGTAIVGLVTSAGHTPDFRSLSLPAVQKAALAVAADARSSCGLDLSGAARRAVPTPSK